VCIVAGWRPLDLCDAGAVSVKSGLRQKSRGHV